MEIPINFQAEMKTKPKSVSLSTPTGHSNMTILLSLMGLGVNVHLQGGIKSELHNRLANLHCTLSYLDKCITLLTYLDN